MSGRTSAPTDLSPELEDRILTELGAALWDFYVALPTDPDLLTDMVEQANHTEARFGIVPHR